MKHIVAFTGIVGLALIAASIQPGTEPMEAQAAMAVSLPLSANCTSTSCQTGWDSAYISSINDESDCRLVTNDREEIQGCVAYVRESNQERLLQDAVDYKL